MAMPAAVANPTRSSSSASLNASSDALVGEVEVPEHRPPHGHGDAEERPHRRMARREAEAVGMGPEVGEAKWPGIGDEQAEDPVTLGQLADVGSCLLVDPHSEEVGQEGARRVKDAEGAVASVGQRRRSIDDVLQDGEEIQVGTDRDHGVEKLTEAPGRAGADVLHRGPCYERSSASSRVVASAHARTPGPALLARDQSPRLGDDRHGCHRPLLPRHPRCPPRLDRGQRAAFRHYFFALGPAVHRGLLRIREAGATVRALHQTGRRPRRPGAPGRSPLAQLTRRARPSRPCGNA